jgi:hypothetical protein
MSDQLPEGRPPVPPPPARSDRSPWNWVLIVPLLTVLYPPLYNRATPEVFDIPFFYWYQMAIIPLSVGCTLLVYSRGGRR